MREYLNRFTLLEYLLGAIFIILTVLLFKSGMAAILLLVVVLGALSGLAISMYMAKTLMVVSYYLYVVLVSKKECSLEEELNRYCIWDGIKNWIDSK